MFSVLVKKKWGGADERDADGSRSKSFVHDVMTSYRSFIVMSKDKM